MIDALKQIHLELNDDLRELASLYAVGALPAEEIAAYEAHLSQGCEVCRAEVASFREVTGAIGLTADPETPREETLRALDDLVRQGKVRALGEAATFATADDLNSSQAIAAANGLTSFATIEANRSILVRDAEKAIIQ